LQYFGPKGLYFFVNKYIVSLNYYYNNGSFSLSFINLLFILIVLSFILFL